MDRSIEMHAAYREAANRFDQFVLGMNVAICAYLAQSMEFGRIGVNIPTMFLSSLVVFGLAVACGFKRIESMIHIFRRNHQLLGALEKHDERNALDAATHLQKEKPRAVMFYKLRNWLMFAGAALYVAAKILDQY